MATDTRPAADVTSTVLPSREDIDTANTLVLHAQSHTTQPSQERSLSNFSDTFDQTNTLAQDPQQHDHHQSSSFPAETQDFATRPGDALPHSRPSIGQTCSNCGTNTTPLWRRTPNGDNICNACGLYYKARGHMRPIKLKRSTQNLQQSHAPTHGGCGDQCGCHSSANGTTLSAGTCPGGGLCNGTGGNEGCNGCPAYNNRVKKTAQSALAQSRDITNTSVDVEIGGTPVTSLAANGGSADNVIVACQNCATTVTPLWRRNDDGHNICNACGT